MVIYIMPRGKNNENRRKKQCGQKERFGLEQAYSKQNSTQKSRSRKALAVVPEKFLLVYLTQENGEISLIFLSVSPLAILELVW